MTYLRRLWGRYRWWRVSRRYAKRVRVDAAKAKPLTWSASSLLAERQKAHRDHPVEINWHAAAVQMAYKWLAADSATKSLRSLGTLTDERPLTGALGRFGSFVHERAIAAEFTHPFVVIMWQQPDGTSGIQMIGARAWKDDE